MVPSQNKSSLGAEPSESKQQTNSNDVKVDIESVRGAVRLVPKGVSFE